MKGLASCPTEADSRPKAACKQRHTGVSGMSSACEVQADGARDVRTFGTATVFLRAPMGLVRRLRTSLRPRHSLIEDVGNVDCSP